MDEVKFRDSVESARYHLRSACKALYLALGHANGQAPEFEKICEAATAALQLLAKVESSPSKALSDPGRGEGWGVENIRNITPAQPVDAQAEPEKVEKNTQARPEKGVALSPEPGENCSLPKAIFRPGRNPLAGHPGL